MSLPDSRGLLTPRQLVPTLGDPRVFRCWGEGDVREELLASIHWSSLARDSLGFWRCAPPICPTSARLRAGSGCPSGSVLGAQMLAFPPRQPLSRCDELAALEPTASSWWLPSPTPSPFSFHLLALLWAGRNSSLVPVTFTQGHSSCVTYRDPFSFSQGFPTIFSPKN